MSSTQLFSAFFVAVFLSAACSTDHTLQAPSSQELTASRTNPAVLGLATSCYTTFDTDPDLDRLLARKGANDHSLAEGVSSLSLAAAVGDTGTEGLVPPCPHEATAGIKNALVARTYGLVGCIVYKQGNGRSQFLRPEPIKLDLLQRADLIRQGWTVLPVQQDSCGPGA